ncbi:MAG: site-specific DNA-methyltransferase [Saprospiraceae bacterium]|nr:MAG: site-specific DNA-methyltransferase [Saprospiraceae bacterium]
MDNSINIFPTTERERLFEQLNEKLETAYQFNRKLVSFQANKNEPVYRWFKYKEGFSSSLVKYFLKKFAPKPGRVLDPFAGAGTTLFAGQELGWESHGIELLPVGAFVMKVREAVLRVDFEKLKGTINKLWSDIGQMGSYDEHLRHIPITKDAFPDETENYLNKYLTICSNLKDKDIQTLLRFAAFAVLEEISYTRKDGQYLRWDYRSNRKLLSKPFDKGKILTFREAVSNKLQQMLTDLSPHKPLTLFDQVESNGHSQHPVNIIEGSCLEELPRLKDESFDFIVTSPPYCNRYDYTRTYALELVYLGYDNQAVRDLRQTMLSCTVENKEKIGYLQKLYASLGEEKAFGNILDVYDGSPAMTEVNEVLNELNRQGKLNNANISRLVKNYFLEMCFVIREMARVLKSGGRCVMVNDNVRYGGEEIPVDLILSEFAENFGFTIEKIFVLPKGKGNSSQQMGNYGRTEIRKCIYLWLKQ